MSRNHRRLQAISTGNAEDQGDLRSTIDRDNQIGGLLRRLDRIRRLDTNADLRLPLPRVVICGSENVGKSSVVERLVNLSLFPRNDGITTRMPIVLRLRKVTEQELKRLYNEHGASGPFNRSHYLIRMSFNDTRPGGAQMSSAIMANTAEHLQNYVQESQTIVRNLMEGAGLVESELLLEAWATNAVNLEIIDLPGVFAAAHQDEDQNMPAVSRRITRRYLQDPNSVVVVVVQSGLNAVVNDGVVGMLAEIGRQTHSICALTFCDRAPVNLMNRIRGNAGDVPRGLTCVALVNNDTEVENPVVGGLNTSLNDERVWFRAHHGGLSITTQATIGALNHQIIVKMRQLIRDQWAPQAISQLTDSRAQIARGKDQLGSMNYDRADVIGRLQSAIRSIATDQAFWQGYNFNGASPPANTSELNHLERWFVSIEHKWPKPSSVLEQLIALFEKIAQGDVAINQPLQNLRVERFGRLIAAIQEDVRNQGASFCERADRRWSREIEIWKVSVEARHGPRFVPELVQEATNILRAIVFAEILAHFSAYTVPGQFNHVQYFQEDDNTAERRRNLTQQDQIIVEALGLVNQLLQG